MYRHCQPGSCEPCQCRALERGTAAAVPPRACRGGLRERVGRGSESVGGKRVTTGRVLKMSSFRRQQQRWARPEDKDEDSPTLPPLHPPPRSTKRIKEKRPPPTSLREGANATHPTTQSRSPLPLHNKAHPVNRGHWPGLCRNPQTSETHARTSSPGRAVKPPNPPPAKPTGTVRPRIPTTAGSTQVARQRSQARYRDSRHAPPPPPKTQHSANAHAAHTPSGRPP